MIKFILLFGVVSVFLFPLLIGIVVALFYGIWRALTYETRFRKFFSKYDNNDEIARMIASGRIWTGQTADQLRDAKGAPVRIENQGESEIWIYPGKALSPQGTRVELFDGRVRTWA